MARRAEAYNGRAIPSGLRRGVSHGITQDWITDGTVFSLGLLAGITGFKTDSDDAHFRGSDHCRNFVVYAEFSDGAAYMELYRAWTEVEDDRDLVCRLAIG